MARVTLDYLSQLAEHIGVSGRRIGAWFVSWEYPGFILWTRHGSKVSVSATPGWTDSTTNVPVDVLSSRDGSAVKSWKVPHTVAVKWSGDRRADTAAYMATVRPLLKAAEREYGLGSSIAARKAPRSIPPRSRGRDPYGLPVSGRGHAQPHYELTVTSDSMGGPFWVDVVRYGTRAQDVKLWSHGPLRVTAAHSYADAKRRGAALRARGASVKVNDPRTHRRYSAVPPHLKPARSNPNRRRR